MAQVQTIRLSQTKFDELFKRLSRLETMMVKLLEKIDEPQYGSDEWWEWSERKADEDIKTNRLVRFDSVKDAVKWLNS